MTAFRRFTVLRGLLHPARGLHRLLNRGLPAERTVRLEVAWPLPFLPWLLLVQVLTPSPVWMTLLVALAGLYGLAYLWARALAQGLELARRRRGTILVVGDALEEHFWLRNRAPVPALWVELDDRSHLPGYRPSQVVSCSAHGEYSWRSQAHCSQRGLFRLGPHRLLTGDPLGLFRVQIQHHDSQVLLVYPRVAQLPTLALPRGSGHGRDRRRRPLHGSERAASVRTYLPGDSLRHVHWRATAHRGDLMVVEVEEEPSGEIWLALDLDAQVHRGQGPQSTLEFAIVLAASLAAELLQGREPRAVGLLAVGRENTLDASGDGSLHTLLLPPQAGPGALWQILAALAPVQPGPVDGARLLRRHRDILARGHTLVWIGVVHAQAPPTWLPELLHLRRSGVQVSARLVAPGISDQTPEDRDAQAGLQDLLARQEIPTQVLPAGTELRPALTYRRRRRVVRTTPTGGAVVYEVEEEVG